MEGTEGTAGREDDAVWVALDAVVRFLSGLPDWAWLAAIPLFLLLGLLIAYRTPRQPRDTLDTAGNASVSLWRPALRALGRIFFP